MGVGTFRALQGLKMAEVDNSRALAEFRKKLLLHKELDARLKTGKQTDLCVCVCVCVCVSLDKMLLQGLRIDRFSCIPTRRSVFFVFGNDNFCFRFRGMVYQYKDREKKKNFLVSASLQGERCDQQEPFTVSRLFWRIEEWRRRILSVVMMMWGTRNLGFQTLACLRDRKVSLLLFLFYGHLH